jgi:hypothetical protein
VLLLHFRCCVFAVVFQIGSELFRLPLGLVLVKTSVVMAGSPKEKSFTTPKFALPTFERKAIENLPRWQSSVLLWLQAFTAGIQRPMALSLRFCWNCRLNSARLLASSISWETIHDDSIGS